MLLVKVCFLPCITLPEKCMISLLQHVPPPIYLYHCDWYARSLRNHRPADWRRWITSIASISVRECSLFTWGGAGTALWLSSKKLSTCMVFGFSLYIVKVDLSNEAKCIQPYTFFSECNIQSGWESAKIFWVFKECHFETVPPTKPYNTVKDGSHNWGVSAHHIY